MSKFLRRIVMFIVALALLAIGGLYFLDGLARRAVEDGSTTALGVPTSVGNADLSLLGRSFELENITIADPPGFSGRPFVHAARAGCEVPFATLLQDKVVIENFTIEGLELEIESRGAATNYQVIIAHLEEFQKSRPRGGKRYVIRNLAIRDITARVNLTQLGGIAPPVVLEIPELRLQNVGADGDSGVVLAEVAAVIIKALLGSVAGRGEFGIPADLSRDLRQRLAHLGDFGSAGVRVLDDLGRDANKLLEDLGTLFEKK